MNTLKISTLVLIFFIQTRFALADQCIVLDPHVADGAVILISKGTKLVKFCEPCNDSQKKVFTVNSIASLDDADHPGEKYIKINGETVDLAYLYIYESAGEDGNSIFRNVSNIVGCPSQLVSETIEVPPKVSTKTASLLELVKGFLKKIWTSFFN